MKTSIKNKLKAFASFLDAVSSKVQSYLRVWREFLTTLGVTILTYKILQGYQKELPIPEKGKPPSKAETTIKRKKTMVDSTIILEEIIK